MEVHPTLLATASTASTLLAQIAAVGGTLVFGMFTIWIFGRVFSDHTVKDLLAMPTSRTAVVGAKFIVIVGWCLVV